jgi:hypothetical protein
MRLKRIPFFLEWLWYSIENPTYKKFYDILDRLPDRFKFPEFDLQKIRQRYKKNIPILDSWFSWKIYKMPAIKDFWRDGWFPRWYEEYHKPHAFELIKTGLKKESRKRKILDFVQKNPEATSREIQQKFTIKKSDLETFLPTQDRF